MRKKNGIFQICQPDQCDKAPVSAKTGNKEHTYCCQKGLDISLSDFQEYLKEKTSYRKTLSNLLLKCGIRSSMSF